MPVKSVMPSSHLILCHPLLLLLWPPHAKRWLVGKDPDAWRDWGQEEKGTIEDEILFIICQSLFKYFFQIWRHSSLITILGGIEWLRDVSRVVQLASDRQTQAGCSGYSCLVKIFSCGPFVKSSLNLLQWRFYVSVFWPRSLWDLGSQTGDQTHIPCIGRWSLNHWTTREVPIQALDCLPSMVSSLETSLVPAPSEAYLSSLPVILSDDLQHLLVISELVSFVSNQNHNWLGPKSNYQDKFKWTQKAPLNSGPAATQLPEDRGEREGRLGGRVHIFMGSHKWVKLSSYRVRSRSCQEIYERREVSVFLNIKQKAGGFWEVSLENIYNFLPDSTETSSYGYLEATIPWTSQRNLRIEKKKKAGLKDTFSFLALLLPSSAWPEVGLEGSWHNARGTDGRDLAWGDAAWSQGWEAGQAGHKAGATLRAPAEREQAALQLFCPNQEVEISNYVLKTNTTT